MTLYRVPITLNTRRRSLLIEATNEAEARSKARELGRQMVRVTRWSVAPVVGEPELRRSRR